MQTSFQSQTMEFHGGHGEASHAAMNFSFGSSMHNDMDRFRPGQSFGQHSPFSAFNGGRSGNARQTTSSFFQQTTRGPNGFTKTTIAQQINRSPGSGMNRGGGFERTSAHFDNCRTNTRQSAWSQPDHARQSNVTFTPTGNNQGTLDAKDYSVHVNKSDSSVKITDKLNGDVTEYKGDPHKTVHAGTANAKTTTIQGNDSVRLSDGTMIDINTKPSTSKGQASYTNSVVVHDPNGQTHTISGIDQQTKDNVTYRDGR